MIKHAGLRLVYKIHSSRLRRSRWNLQLSISQARENKELISLSESQCLRFIDELNGICDCDLHIESIKSQIRKLKGESNLSISRPKIKQLYEELDKYQFKKDYVCVVIDNISDYYKLYKRGFKINGIKYRRLLGTTGGVKNNTIVFVNEDLLPEIKRRIDNGRELSKAFSPAKLEAYMSLVCSSSVPVSYPKGVVVVHDCITHFTSDIIELDDTGLDQPKMEYIPNKDIELNDSDGYGIAMPSLLKRWGEELGVEYILPGCVIRNSFCKGTVYPIDFQKFAKKYNKSKIIDVWGNEHNVDSVELILTESMLKLWDSYSSIDDYLNNCMKNKYTFAITKTSEAELENERTMNYQFLQSYDFTDEQIQELVMPTVGEIKDIISGDYRKTILYVKGVGLTENNIKKIDSTFGTALMIEPAMINDPYVRNQINQMIRKRIDEAKVGVLNVPGNYSLVSGDPYSLCQSMFGIEITGLLKSGQVYSKYWVDKGITRIVSFRAPMTSHNNIRLLDVVHNDEMDDFYKYMVTPTIFNSWDTCADAMNGFDKDGDCVINSSLPLLVNNTKTLPAIVCIQRKAPKCIPTEDDLMNSNINSFGNAVGEVTNKITSMFEVRSRFDKNSDEYKILDYRIKCGQLYQQNAIDKTKGIEAKPMPDTWYSWISNKVDEDASEEKKATSEFNRKLIADIKPYFMKYIYPSDKSKYQEYIRKNNEKCIMKFRMSLDDLIVKSKKTKEETIFIEHYYKKIPLGMGPCTINKICWKIEEEFSEMQEGSDIPFDYSILMSDAHYSKKTFNDIKKIYESYKRELREFMKFAKTERLKGEEKNTRKHLLNDNFKRKCFSVCPNEDQLCNIILDLCYKTSNGSKQFAWDICSDVFIRNLLRRKNFKFSYPTACPDGDIFFNGERYTMKPTEVKPVIEMEDNF